MDESPSERKEWRLRHGPIGLDGQFADDGRWNLAGFGHVTLTGLSPTSGMSISLASSRPPVQIAVILGSPCYQPAPGEDPPTAELAA